MWASMCAVLAGLLTVWAWADSPAKVPDDIGVDGPLVLYAHAHGDQIYTWQASSKSWKLKAPDASFTSEAGPKGRHYAGPAWDCDDGSKVVGRRDAEHPAPDSSAIGWLRLVATSHGGNGILSKVTYIQRINTTGGKAPSSPGAKDGEEVRVPYTADYIFYGPGASTRPTLK
jgi:hypothetical protein